MRTMVSLNDTADPFAALCALERSCNPLALTSTQRDSSSDLSWHSSKQALIFDVGGMLWALPRSWITEVVRQPRLARIPNAARELQGLTNVRGILVPVLDLAALLGLAGSTTTAPAVLICLQQGRQVVGLGARRVLGLRSMAAGLQRAVPAPPWACPKAWCGALALQPGLWAGVLDWPALLAFSGVQADTTSV